MQIRFEEDCFERDRNISRTCVFIFHHSIQHDEASGETFYNEVDCPNNIFKLPICVCTVNKKFKILFYHALR